MGQNFSAIVRSRRSHHLECPCITNLNLCFTMYVVGKATINRSSLYKLGYLLIICSNADRHPLLWNVASGHCLKMNQMLHDVIIVMCDAL